MTLYAIRLTIGDKAFDTLLRRWAARPLTEPATTADLLKLAEEVSGKQLDDLFQAWLYKPGKPAPPPGFDPAASAAVAATARTAATGGAPTAAGVRHGLR